MELTEQHNQVQLQHHEAIKTIAILGDRANQLTKRPSKMKAQSQLQA